MFIKQFVAGGDRNFAYLVADEEKGKAVVVDPSYGPDNIFKFARSRGFEIIYIFNTHGHGDHVAGNQKMTDLTGVRPLRYGSSDPLTGQVVCDGIRFPLGRLEISVIHTPGHTTDSFCLLIDDALFTGDTLFVGKVGGSDFGEGARTLFDSLHDKILSLPGRTRVFPGHDYGTAPESTIGDEKKTNPFLLQPDFDAFLYLKKNWDEYKKKHGIK